MVSILGPIVHLSSQAPWSDQRQISPCIINTLFCLFLFQFRKENEWNKVLQNTHYENGILQDEFA